MKKVVIGLSGGVDSAVAVILLQQQGYHVEGMFMRNWDSSINNDILGNPNDPNAICPQEQDYMDALKAAEILGIQLHRVDFVAEYWEKVFQIFLEEYQHNRTPNPDILCNKEIKFKAFLKHANQLGFDMIAMGHYARINHHPKIQLLRGIDPNKDQSYFLCQLSQQQLAKSLFPIGHLTKAEVRQIAKEHHLNIADKKDSTGICFIGERNFQAFLQNYLPAKPGQMQTLDGIYKGDHMGTMYYTIGQRHGLGIGGQGEPWFVVGKRTQDNILLVGQGKEHPYLYSNRAIIKDVNWIGEGYGKNRSCSAKFRYRQKDVAVNICFLENGNLEVTYPSKSKAVTPGQAAVFYDDQIVLGGGTIDQVYMNDDLREY